MLKENNLAQTDENIFIAAACGEKGIAFLKGEGKIGVRYKEKPRATSGNFDVTVDGRNYKASLNGDTVVVNGKSFNVVVGAAGQAVQKSSAAPANGTQTDVISPVPGTVMKLLVNEGDHVAKAQPIAILEVMKMENPIPAPADGVVEKIAVHQGDQVVTGQLLMTLK